MSEKMNWTALRKEVANRTHTTEAEAGAFLSAMVDQIKAGLIAENSVRINGLGTFQLKEMAPRKSVNVNTGEQITIPGYKKLSFTAETTIREAMNRGPVDSAVRQEIDEIVDPIQKLGAQAEEIVGILGEIAEMGNIEQVEGNNQRAEVEPIAEVEPVVEAEPEKPVEPEKPETPEKPATPEKPQKAEVKRPWLTAGITILIFALLLAGTYLYIGHKFVSWVDQIGNREQVEGSNQRSEVEPIAEVVPAIEAEPVVEAEPVAEAEAMPDLTKTLCYEELTEGSRLAWIAYKKYGSKDLWVFIYEANRDQLKTPHHIKVGTRIRVPKLEGRWKNADDPQTRAAIEVLEARYN